MSYKTTATINKVFQVIRDFIIQISKKQPVFGRTKCLITILLRIKHEHMVISFNCQNCKYALVYSHNEKSQKKHVTREYDT